MNFDKLKNQLKKDKEPINQKEIIYFKENNIILELTQDLVRKEIEKVDNYLGTMVLMSMAGGTGSGLGSRFMQMMRDEYPSTYLNAACVYPVGSGESPLQHYNCLLSSSYL